MEQHGIYYYFKHDNGKHSLVLVDLNNMHQPVPGLADIPFYPLDREGRGDEERIVSWTSERRFRTTKVELKDYNYQDPNTKLISDAQGQQKYIPELAYSMIFRESTSSNRTEISTPRCGSRPIRLATGGALEKATR